MRCNLRTRIGHAFTGFCKSIPSLELLGCSVDEWMSYLISTFTEGMTTEKLKNGEIHIDHKIPCCAFDLTDTEQQKICFNWRNTRCLWKKDNLLKIKEDIKLDWKKRI